MSTFKLYLFGSPRLERGGMVVKIARRKALALLSYLAATGKPHARDSLATLFWPDYSQPEARVALSRHLSYLNKLLVDEMLVLEGESVALSAGFWLDVTEFAEVLAAHPTVTAGDLPTVQAAIDLYQADFLAGFTLPDCPDFDAWQAFQAESLRQSLRTAQEKVALAQAAIGDDENAIATARRWLALDPLDEAAHRTLIQLYAQFGQQAAALRQFEQCRRIMADELDASPTAETTALVERIRRGDLRQGDGGHSQFTIENSQLAIAPPAHNLPAQTTPFIGRETELAEVTRLLVDPAVRLLTIIGQGGMGKTRLARQSGRHVLNHFPDGVWYLSLAAVDRDAFGPALNPLLNGLAGVLGVTLRSTDSAEEDILNHLRDRQLLLILDNLEHLLESGAVISTLLRGAAGITALVTSRERLNLQEEWLFPLAGLALPQAELQETTQSAITEAVQLFVQVAQRVQPTFDPQHSLHSIAHICRLVEGMPLGIELAASWVRYMTPAAIAQEIEDDIDFLTTNVRNLPARHRSLRAVFDHSWRLLSAEEQAVLPQLAVFHGGFRPAEARAVTGASQVLLATLVDKSLLAVAADGRYDLHERLGQYLLDKLRQDLSLYQAANDRHSLAYLNLLQLDPTEPYRQTTLQRLSEDVDNLRAAWHWAGDHDHWSALRRARRGLHLFCLNKGWLLEENEFYERTISRLKHRLAQPGVSRKLETETATDPETQILLVALTCHHSETQARLGIHDPARHTMLDENLSILRTFGPVAYPELIDALIGAVFPHLRRLVDGHEAKRRYGQEAFALSQSVGDGYGQHLALQGLGFAALFAGEFEKAASYADLLKALAESVGAALRTVLSMRGYLALAQGDYPQAEANYRRCHQLVVSVDPHFPAIPFFLAALANTARLQSDTAQAAAYLQQATAIEHALGQGHPAGFRHFRHHEVLLASGYLAEAQGDLPAAQAAFTEILQQDQGQSHYSPAALIGLGWVAVQQEDWSVAQRQFAVALPLIVQLQTAPQALECLAGLAHVEAQTGQREDALAMVTLVLHHPSAFQETKDRLAELHARLAAALPPATVEAVRAGSLTSRLWTVIASLCERYAQHDLSKNVTL